MYYAPLIYYGLLIIAIIATLHEPFWGVVYYYYLAFFRPQDYYHWALTGSRFSYYIGLVTIFSYFLAKTRNGYVIPKTKETFLMLVFCITMGISTYFSPLPERSWPLFFVFAKITLFYFFALAMIDSEKKFKIMLWVLIYSFAYYAIWTNQRFIFEGIKMVEGPGLAEATYRDNNLFALTFVIAIPICFYMRYIIQHKLLKISLLGIVPVLIHAVICTFSRGGYLGMLTASGYSLLKMRKKAIMILAILIFIPMLMRMQGKEHRERIRSITVRGEEQDLSIKYRREAWKSGWRMMNTHPLLGVGLDNFEIVEPQYNPIAEGRVAHNTYIQIGAEAGIPAMVAYILIVLTSFLTLHKLRHIFVRDKLLPRLYYYIVMLEGSLLGFFICSLFLTLEVLEPAYFLFCMVVCLKKLVERGEFNPKGVGLPSSGSKGPN
jgi:probable O-glycosylation ligase (exosortase A-associated)